MSETIALQVRNLYKFFGRRHREAVKRLKSGANRRELEQFGTAAVIDTSFDVAPGEIFVVMGLSGSGKSTLIRMLNGLLEPSDGTVSVFGEVITGMPAKQLREIRKQRMSMVFQHFALLPHRTVLDNAAYGLEVKGLPVEQRRARAKEVLARVGLAGWEDRLPDQLSGGMRQRVGLARALAADTDILLMDEAFSALDPLIRREMQEQLLELQSELGKTIVFITHDLNEAMFLGDRIAVMRDGRVVQIGTPEEILTDPANDYVAQFVQDVDRARVLTASAVMEPARATVPLASGLRAALRVMRDLQTAAVFVLDSRRRLLGVVHDRDVIAHIRAGGRSLDEILRRDIPSTSPDTVLSELLELAIETPLPVPVVDEQQRLLGVVPRVALLAILANVPHQVDDAAAVEPPATVPVEIVMSVLGGPEVPDTPTPVVAEEVRP